MFIKRLIPDFFVMLFRFSICKIRHFFSAKKSFENLRDMIGRNVFIKSFIFTFLLRIEQHLLSFLNTMKYE